VPRRRPRTDCVARCAPPFRRGDTEVTRWKQRADDTSAPGKPGVDAVAHALRRGRHLLRRPLPDAEVNAAPQSALVSGRFSTDESVATRCRFQHRPARSFHGLCSPSRSPDPRRRLHEQRASQWPASELLVGTERRSPGRVPVALSRASLGWLLRRGLWLAPSSATPRRSWFPPCRLFSGSRGAFACLVVPTAKAVTFVGAGSFRVCPSVWVVKRGSQDALAPCAAPEGGVGGGSPVGQPH